MTRELAFGRFVFDLARGSLRCGDREVALRPESRAILRVLAGNPDRVLATEELLEAAWPGLIVGDELLSQAIDELRRALADEDGRLIVSIPPRGYRFVPAAAPQERRKARGWQPLRWRWIYGILAPLLLALTVAVLLFMNHGKPAPVNDGKPAVALRPLLTKITPGR